MQSFDGCCTWCHRRSPPAVALSLVPLDHAVTDNTTLLNESVRYMIGVASAGEGRLTIGVQHDYDRDVDSSC